MNKYIIEFIGTFFLVLTIGLSANPIAIGVVLAALVYMGGYISGAHYNPAVTLAIWMQKKIKPNEAGVYVVVQLIAAIAAAMVYQVIHGDKMIVAPGFRYSFGAALVAEIVFTFALVSVVLHTAVSKKTAGNNYYGIAIGFILMAGAFSVGTISGGAFNPAVGLGPNIYNFGFLSQHWSNLALYLIGPLLGGFLASYIFGLTQAKSKK
ncbi:MAG TPA: aquaporin [Candidatus Saccharimonadales bacterium]|nr:aquaporin [Candidatus Saccharimonadales bacterium]